MPVQLVKVFPPEVITVMIARIGGLVSAAGIAYELQSSGEISTAQILIAFLAGNIITNPIRTLRRNLPVAMGVFPKKDGFGIVFTVQMFRLISAIIVILILIFFFS